MQKIKFKNTGGPYRTGDGRVIKKGQVFEASPEEIPKAFRDIIVPADSVKPDGRFLEYRSKKPGEDLAYDHRFSYEISHSGVISPQCRSVVDPIHGLLNEALGLKILLAELHGQAAQTKERQDALFGLLKPAQIKARKEGREIPKDLPETAREELIKLKAKGDVLRIEIDIVQARVSGFEQKEVEHNLLPWGPRGMYRGADPIRDADGQMVAYRNGKPYIVDERSPYNGLSLEDYRKKLVIPWQKTHRRLARVSRDSLPPRPEGM